MPDSTVGPYHILARLGAGGMGEVLLGHDPRLQRQVALKCLTAVEAQPGDVRARVLREARAAARLNHPNIAGVYDVLEEHGRTFIVMEYVEGETLSARLARGRMPMDDVRRVGRQLASALAAAHAQGVIHRDLKPANIQVARDGSIKVLDFGVAKLSSTRSTGPEAPTEHASAEPTLAGNPGTLIYMSPEQLQKQDVDGRSDIYSAGVILFLMATGQRPFQTDDPVAYAVAVSTTDAPAAASVNPDVPADLSATIARALERDPRNRFQSARELEDALAGSTVDVFGVSARPRRAWALAAAGVAAVLLLAWAGVAIRQRTAPAPAASAPARRAVAVLPLENLSGDPSKGYLATGVAETLTMALSKMPGLTVLSHGEVREETGRERDVRTIARDLDVSFVVDGSVQQAGERLRVTLRVIRPDGTVAWSDAYEDNTAAIFALQRTMAEDLVHQIEGRASAAADLTVPTTANVDALTAYWQGRALLDSAVSDADFRAASASFRQAIAGDPNFALGYAGLADTLWQQYQVTHDGALPRQALEAGLTALRLDAGQPATRVAVATVYQGLGQNDAAADQLRRALELQPSNDDAHRVLARVLMAQGKPDEAIGELQQALAYRPRRWVNYNALGGQYFQLRRLREAAATFQRALEIDPNDARTYASLGAVYAEMGEFNRAIDMSERSVKITPTGLALTNMGTAYYRLGRFTDAVTAYEGAMRLDAKSPLLHGNLGDAYLRVNRNADAAREFALAREGALAALRVNDKDTRAMSRASVFEAKLGLKKEATAHAALAVALAPRDLDVQYKQAVVASLIGDRATALRALGVALTLGFKADEARNDYDLSAIKDSPEFTALLNSHR
ncbi:MAG: tetratricopeptide repeat protein [Acidobacteriia bacterium]|nr:tetratricopeptide repeat protein [Terriglobia bacterium]